MTGWVAEGPPQHGLLILPLEPQHRPPALQLQFSHVQQLQHFPLLFWGVVLSKVSDRGFVQSTGGRGLYLKVGRPFNSQLELMGQASWSRSP
jgi:hypothetical protein